MTARENPASDRMAGAAARRPNPAREPGRPAIRTKPVRVTAGLDPATYTELNRWVGSALSAASDTRTSGSPTRPHQGDWSRRRCG
jgi:hypothetical protein